MLNSLITLNILSLKKFSYATAMASVFESFFIIICLEIFFEKILNKKFINFLTKFKKS